MAKRRTKRAAKKKKRDKSQVELLPDLAVPAVDEEQDEEPVGELSAGDTSVEEVSAKPDVPKGNHVEPEVARPVPEKPPSAPDLTPAPPRPQGNQLARARDLVQTGRIEEAIDLYTEILGENPHNLRAHNNLGILLDELGQHDTAVEHLESALEVEPDNVEVLTNLASALTQLARFTGADASIRKALRLSPDDLAARLAQGILSFRRGLYLEAEAELQWVCEHDPGLGAAFYYRAEALNRTSQFPKATELMLRAAELLPDDARPVYTLGHLYDRQGRPVEAAEMYRRARDLQSS